MLDPWTRAREVPVPPTGRPSVFLGTRERETVDHVDPDFDAYLHRLQSGDRPPKFPPLRNIWSVFKAITLDSLEEYRRERQEFLRDKAARENQSRRDTT